MPEETAPVSESIDSIIARSGLDRAVTEPNPAATDAAAEVDAEGEPLLPEPVQRMRPQSARERLLARDAAQRERSAADAIRADAERTRRELDELRSTMTSRELAASKALESGNMDAWLKATGFQGSMVDLQRRYLEAQGAIPKPDPKLSALEQRIAEYEAREAAERDRHQQYQLEQQQQAELAAIQQDVVSELEASRLGELVGLAGFVPELTRMLTDDPSLTTKQGAANLLQDYREHFLQLEKVAQVFGWSAARAASPEKIPTAAGARSERKPSSLPQSRSADATPPPSRESREDFFKRVAAETGIRF
jgi:hypothetical protein